MRVVVLGATGMLGQGVVRECLRDAGVETVVTIGRRGSGLRDGKLREIVRADLFTLEEEGVALAGFDLCLYCLGETSLGKTEAEYRRLTVDLTVAVATALLRYNPELRMGFISGAGSDGTGTSQTMWARVKGEAENAMLTMPFAASYVFRPAFVQPIGEIAIRTGWMRVAYAMLTPLAPVIRRLAPGSFSTTEELGRAMIAVGRYGFRKRVLESGDFQEAAGGCG